MSFVPHGVDSIWDPFLLQGNSSSRWTKKVALMDGVDFQCPARRRTLKSSAAFSVHDESRYHGIRKSK
jgi:hypothetical protein